MKESRIAKYIDSLPIELGKGAFSSMVVSVDGLGAGLDGSNPSNCGNCKNADITACDYSINKLTCVNTDGWIFNKWEGLCKCA